ncbi:G5 domain family [Streptococcus pneumoniae]|uniref:pneumococcal collagen-like adhesin PclA n=1 Tax=Streptococcus pneumoniae TaxID=1313 RepID=UPI000B597BE1|nr:YSIRK-type signal peptide-containing protein [Streptococcus pneumoniae]SNJ42508.1 G5 domain-containing protein [Streptococcus pneumoniae]SNN08715.1 G5 domain-containing protein [Streptococcus pneumoniae]SNO05382.1 G5 domain family [Streptococcus pneumoniae]SNO61732.1 G5 domain family [Streptococcus pneumoniae]HET5224349.1 YSIRK-type signal peptide-containing protein [Streptococcus pneumoniae]
MKHSHKKSFDWYSMQQRYSIRKYYFGAVSVLLGTALVLGAAASVQTVQAEENKQETTNSISVGRGEAATKPAEVSASNKEKTYAAPTVANPVETTPVKTGEVTKPAEKVEEAKDKKEEVTHQDAIDKSKLLTALSRAKKLESKLYTEASAANLQTSIQAGQSLLGKADASEAELSAAESSIQSSIIGLELRSNSNKGTVSETPVAKKANIVEAKEETNPAATTDRSAVDSAVLPTSTAAKVETTSAPASTNEILKPGLSLSDARQNPAIRKEDVDRGYSGFRTAGSGFRAAGPENKPILNPNNTIAFSDISQGSHSFRGIGHSRGGREIHYDVTTVRRGNNINFTINYFAPGNLREFVNNNFILDKGTGYGEPTPATVITPNLRNQVKNISKGGNFVSHSGYSLEAAVETNKSQTITFSLPITNPNGDLSLRLRPVEFNVDQGGSGTGTSNDPYSNSNYYFETDPLYLDANPNQANPLTTSFNTKVDFQTLYIPTTKLAEGVTELVSEGVEGEKSQAYRLHKFGDQYVLGLPVGNATTVTAVRKDEAGHKGVEITVDNHDGSQPTTVFVQDGAKGETGATGQDGQTPTITTQRGQDGQSTVVTITTSGKDPVTFTVKDGKNGKDGRAPKIKVEDITSPSRIRRDIDAAATPTRNGIRVTVYDDVNDNGVYDEGVDKVLNSKDIYNGIDGRDGSAPTITTKDNGDGTHTITVQNPDGSESTTVVKDGKDGKTANITTTENPDGSHTITVTNPDGSTKETVVKNGKDGKTPKVEVTDNNDGTHTVKVTDGDGNVTNAIIKDGKDGKAATATTTENPDGSHTVTITNPDGTKNEFVVKNGRDGVDGRTPTASVRDNGDGSHTIVITNPEGVTTETTVRDGKSPKVTITDEQNGTHKISVLNGDGTTTETIIKDGKSPVATVRDNQDGTYTIRVENGNGTVSETTVRDGKSPTAKVVDNGDGTHTITVVNSDGTTTTTTVRDGREPKLEVIDNNDGSHTIKVTGADGKGTTTTIFDGKSPKANIVDNGDGTHTLTIVDSDGREYKSIIKDGKDGKDSVSPTVTVKNNNDGTHVVTITNPDGSKTEMVIKDGKDGKCGCQDKPVPPTPNVPTPEVPVKPVPAQPTPNVPTPEVPVQPTPAVSTPEVPVKPVPAVPEQPVVPTPAQPATPVNANPVAPTTGKENRGDKLPETGSQSDYISVLLGSGILLSLYVGRRKED